MDFYNEFIKRMAEDSAFAVFSIIIAFGIGVLVGSQIMDLVR